MNKLLVLSKNTLNSALSITKLQSKMPVPSDLSLLLHEPQVNYIPVIWEGNKHYRHALSMK